MTPERELATRLFELIEGKPINCEDIETLEIIESLLKEAMEKEFLRGHEVSDIRNTEPVRKQARLEDRERCAKIVQQHEEHDATTLCDCLAEIAAQIRELK